MASEKPSFPDCQARAVFRAKSTLLWGVLVFVAGQGVLAYVLSRVHPDIREPEYGNRLLRLREQSVAAPDRPLCLILGSSRTLAGIRPSSLSPWPDEASPQPRLFNFSLLGSGPVRELMTLRRLLAAGHRPSWLLVEVWPPYWPQQGYWRDELHIMLQDLRPEDLHIVRQYFTERGVAVEKLVFETLLPCCGLRSKLLTSYAAPLLSPSQHWRLERFAFWHGGNPDGWRPWLHRGTEEEFHALIDGVKQQTKPCLDHFHISDTADRALREILQICREHRIKAALILMPEHSELRSWYSPTVREQVTAYLDHLHGDYGVPLFDTRDWVPDGGFQDLTHMAPPSAAPFTRRLGREKLWPWFTSSIKP